MHYILLFFCICQILGSDVPVNLSPVSSQSTDGSHDDEATNSFGGIQNPLVSGIDGNCEPKMCYDQKVQNLPASYDMDAVPVKDKGVIGSSKSGSSESADDLNFLLNEPFLDSFANFPNVDDGFIEANDLSNPFETDAGAFEMLAEYLDVGDDSSLYFASDPTTIFGNEDLASNQTLLPQMVRILLKFPCSYCTYFKIQFCSWISVFARIWAKELSKRSSRVDNLLTIVISMLHYQLISTGLLNINQVIVF